MLATLCAALLAQEPVPASRFQIVNPLSGLPWIRVDSRLAAYGNAQGEARRLGLQGRVLWVDGTANLGLVASPAGVESLVAQAADIGFNTIVYDVKPIVGRTLYPSKLTDQLLAWRGQSQPAGNDPLRAMSDAARRHGLSLLVCFNAFSEGHSFAKRDENKPDSEFGDPGWGYRHPEFQTWQYIASPTLRTPGGTVDVHPELDPQSWTAPVALFTKAPSAWPSGASGVWVDAGGRVGGAWKPGDPVPAGVAVAVGSVPLPSTGSRFALGSRAEFKPISEAQTQIPLMMNPYDDRNVERALGFVREVLDGYDVDGIVFDDRLRFGGLNADFSPVTRQAFERRVGRSVKWPDDVYRVTFSPRLQRGIEPGPLFDAWLADRADRMRAFVRRARAEVDRRPGRLLAVYAGAWYGDYPKYGANYGSGELLAGFPFLTRAYRKAGFGADLDLLMTGCYYRLPTMLSAMAVGAPVGQTVEAGGVVSNRVARDTTWTYAGIMLADYYGRPEALAEALQAACATTQGVMVFDRSHRFEEVAPLLKRAFARPRRAPHSVPEALASVRAKRAAADRQGLRDSPFPILEGAPGAGF
jgi:hypothetical protein